MEAESQDFSVYGRSLRAGLLHLREQELGLSLLSRWWGRRQGLCGPTGLEVGPETREEVETEVLDSVLPEGAGPGDRASRVLPRP